MKLLVGERYRERLKRLTEYADVLWMPDNPVVDPRLAGHADLAAINIDNDIFAANDIICDFFIKNNIRIKKAERPQASVYPGDAGLCACITEDTAIFNPNTIDPVIKRQIKSAEKIHVKQGYAKCTVCAVSSRAFITADAGIEKELKKRNISVLKINEGCIRLDGFPTGFIGGATIILNDKIFFTGTLDLHPDKEKIISYTAENNLKPVFLTEEPLFDIGSAVILP